MLSPTKISTMKKGTILGITAGVLVIFVTFGCWPRTSKFRETLNKVSLSTGI